MIPESELYEITPRVPVAVSSAEHVQSGVPVPKAMRVKGFSPDDWEVFVEEWGTSLNGSYVKVRRMGGAGDYGVDIAGFCSGDGFEGEWDNYQCKRYDHPLRPSDIWVELGKVVYYSFAKKYTPPRMYYFVASQDIGTKLEKLLNKPTELRQKLIDNWQGYCQEGITTTQEIGLSGNLLDHLNAFDFTIFSSKSHVELITEHYDTAFHSVRFGGGLPERPRPEVPPETLGEKEVRYVRQLLDAYQDALGEELGNAEAIANHARYNRHFRRQRERFYHAEALRNFARDTVPDGTFSSLQDEVYHGVADIADADYQDGLERMNATVAHAAHISLTSSPLVSVTKVQDRQGMCHQLANEDRLMWVIDDE